MNREYKIYKITYFLMAVNVITYLYTSLKYGLSMSAMQGIQVGGFNPLYVYYYHEYYRMITANFIHFGLMHIFCNVYSLYNLGMLMEKILKEKKYIIVIVVSMISTTLFSYLLFLLFNIGTNSVMGGISGVVFGLIGSLLALSVLYGDVYSYLFKQIVSSVAFYFGGCSFDFFSGSFGRNDWWIYCNVCFRKDRFKKRKNNKLGGI